MYYQKARIVRGQVIATEWAVNGKNTLVVTLPRRIPDDHVLLTVATMAYNAGVPWGKVRRALHFKKFTHRFAAQYIEEKGPKILNPMTGQHEEVLKPCART